MSTSEIMYLGPEGTYAHEVAQKRYHDTGRLLGCESIHEICQKVGTTSISRGVVPIVNSSGGMIYETVDGLLDNKLSLYIEEEIAINVRLALLGRKGEEIRTIFSHFAPLKHCGVWLRTEYPKAKLVEVASTAIAAREAAGNANSAAICNKRASEIYGVEVLRYPLPGLSESNVTHFFIISKKCKILPRSDKTSVAVQLTNSPGSLCNFLEPFAKAKINLSRLISRPIPGKPDECAFFMDIDESIRKPQLKKVLGKLEEDTITMRVVGSYPSFKLYNAS
ncbi:MAG: prephenate dehydratase domain-containing protein [Kiritimatiellia bacterium]|nr:prephenate dehydratase domain-containing protein [Kiritimatiellia bacterium]